MTATPTVTATPSPTSTPTLTPTPTNSPTPLPTATPTSSPTPSPVPTATPAPFGLKVEAPETVAQGGVMVVPVHANTTITAVQATAAGRTLGVSIQGADAVALLGFRSDARTGPATLSLRISFAGGGNAQADYPFSVIATRFPVENIEVSEDEEDLLDPAVMNTEWQKLLGIAARVTPQKWQGPFIRPVQAGITSAFGTRRSYNDGPPGIPHEGADFGAALATPILATNAGTVVVADTWYVRGNAVVLDHGLGVFSGYYHMSQRLVEPGQAVTKGQVIGLVGETGLATGPHLHWDMIAQGAHTNGMAWTVLPLP